MLDGTSPHEGEIRAMTSVLERRGPDGTNVWIEGNVVLGHTLLATTPEASLEALPLTHKETGCTITADVRLDNRDELINSLGLDPRNRIIGDGELILLAYLKWNEACLEHLLGDFAFAIWDPRNMSMFCARDQVGMRQLLYQYRPGRVFTFATEANSVLQHHLVAKRINEGRIADFLFGLEAYDLTSTFYEDVYRLPPAHWLRLARGEVKIQRYWALEPCPTVKLSSDQAYVEAFLDVFTKAIDGRLRGSQSVGAMLSGGVDSGSIVAIASDILARKGQGTLKTFSAINSSGVTCKESLCIKASASIDGIEPHFFSIDDIISNRNELIDMFSGNGEPFDGHMTILRAVYLTARAEGRKSILNGGAGDAILAAQHQLAHLLRFGQFGQALRVARGQESFWGSPPSAWRRLAGAAGQAFVPMRLREIRRSVMQSLSLFFNHERGHIAPDFARRIDLAQRKREAERTAKIAPFPSRESRTDHLLHPWTVVALERYDRVAGSFGIEPRDPFVDLRVIRFCQMLPINQLERDGWPKFILRQAMSTKLPDSVRWRTGKEHLGLEFTRSLLSSLSHGTAWESRLANANGFSLFPADAPPFAKGLSPNDDERFVHAANYYFLSSWLHANKIMKP